ncbi:MAG TPA: GGDEF domain-containing phosphodiesterase [Gallionellaceae bacterium]
MNSSSEGAGLAPATAGMHDNLLEQFAGRLQSILAEAAAKNENVALMMVHAAAIDRTDAREGYRAGNSLSEKIAAILRTKVLRKRDEIEILARDEYICTLPGVPSPEIAMLAAQRVMAFLGAAPLELRQATEYADAAVGIAMFPEHGQDAAALLQHAKHALLAARGRSDRICIYENPVGGLADQSQYVARMADAIEHNSLTLHYMPQVSLRTGKITGAEALLRWTDDALGQVAPHEAVQAAESSGLMDRLSQWVITSAVQQCAQFLEIDPDFKVSINLSPSNLHEPDLPLYIDRALRTWGVDGSNVSIEITESAMITNQAAANEILRELKSYGLRLSVDDFGTGYSSMYYLANMPLDELKIDQSFVRSMLEAPNSAKIVRSLIELAHNLELTVVAEGVEKEEIQAALAHLGCDHAQGYHIGAAMPATELVTRLKQQAQKNNLPPPQNAART